MDFIRQLDSDILVFIQEHIRNASLSKFFIPVTHLGDWGLITILAIILLLMTPKHRRTGFMCILGLLLDALLINLIIKPAVGRMRPYDVIENFMAIVPLFEDKSFPSGHTAAAFVVAVIIYKTMPKRYGIFALILACLIGISRMYVGVHYPTDVLCAAIIGSLMGLLTVKIYSSIEEHFTKRKRTKK